MLITHLNLRKTLRSLDRARAITILCNRNIHSICSLFVFTQILKKEILKYQVEFKNLDSTVNFQFEADGETHYLSNDYLDIGRCSCGRLETVGISILYTVIKAMNLQKVETLWPIIVCFVYYRVFMNDGFYINMPLVEEHSELKLETNTENIKNQNTGESKSRGIENAINACNVCKETILELVLSVNFINCKSDGLFYSKRSRLEFLSGLTVMECIKGDLRFIHEKKIFSISGPATDRKVGEFLARRGMAISAANESYLTLDLQIRSLCNSAFGEYEKFIFKQGHDIEMTAVEHAFLIQFYMYKQRDIYAYMCLNKRKLIDIEKASKFYQRAVILFKEATHCATKTEDRCLFGIKCGDLAEDQVGVLGPILDRMLRIYLSYRKEASMRVFQNYITSKTRSILYSEEADFKDMVLGDSIRKISQTMVEVDTKNVTEFVRSLTI